MSNQLAAARQRRGRSPDMARLTSVVVPVTDSAQPLAQTLSRLRDAVMDRTEILVVVDTPWSYEAVIGSGPEPTTQVRVLLTPYGRGMANCLRHGVDQASGDVVVVVLPEPVDDVSQVDTLAAMVRNGAVVASASRFSPGSRLVGDRRFRHFLSRAAGESLMAFASIGTSDPANHFKAYSTRFVRAVGVESRLGQEVGLELTAKARRLGLPVTEIPTVAGQRPIGRSALQTATSGLHFARWYRFALSGSPAGPDGGARTQPRNPGRRVQARVSAPA